MEENDIDQILLRVDCISRDAFKPDDSSQYITPSVRAELQRKSTECAELVYISLKQMFELLEDQVKRSRVHLCYMIKHKLLYRLVTTPNLCTVLCQLMPDWPTRFARLVSLSMVVHDTSESESELDSEPESRLGSVLASRSRSKSRTGLNNDDKAMRRHGAGDNHDSIPNLNCNQRSAHSHSNPPNCKAVRVPDSPDHSLLSKEILRYLMSVITVLHVHQIKFFPQSQAQTSPQSSSSLPTSKKYTTKTLPKETIPSILSPNPLVNPLPLNFPECREILSPPTKATKENSFHAQCAYHENYLPDHDILMTYRTNENSSETHRVCKENFSKYHGIRESIHQFRRALGPGHHTLHLARLMIFTLLNAVGSQLPEILSPAEDTNPLKQHCMIKTKSKIENILDLCDYTERFVFCTRSQEGLAEYDYEDLDKMVEQIVKQAFPNDSQDSLSSNALVDQNSQSVTSKKGKSLFKRLFSFKSKSKSKAKSKSELNQAVDPSYDKLKLISMTFGLHLSSSGSCCDYNLYTSLLRAFKVLQRSVNSLFTKGQQYAEYILPQCSLPAEWYDRIDGRIHSGVQAAEAVLNFMALLGRDAKYQAPYLKREQRDQNDPLNNSRNITYEAISSSLVDRPKTNHAYHQSSDDNTFEETQKSFDYPINAESYLSHDEENNTSAQKVQFRNTVSNFEQVETPKNKNNPQSNGRRQSDVEIAHSNENSPDSYYEEAQKTDYIYSSDNLSKPKLKIRSHSHPVKGGFHQNQTRETSPEKAKKTAYEASHLDFKDSFNHNQNHLGVYHKYSNFNQTFEYQNQSPSFSCKPVTQVTSVSSKGVLAVQSIRLPVHNLPPLLLSEARDKKLNILPSSQKLTLFPSLKSSSSFQSDRQSKSDFYPTRRRDLSESNDDENVGKSDTSILSCSRFIGIKLKTREDRYDSHRNTGVSTSYSRDSSLNDSYHAILQSPPLQKISNENENGDCGVDIPPRAEQGNLLLTSPVVSSVSTSEVGSTSAELSDLLSGSQISSGSDAPGHDARSRYHEDSEALEDLHLQRAISTESDRNVLEAPHPPEPTYCNTYKGDFHTSSFTSYSDSNSEGKASFEQGVKKETFVSDEMSEENNVPFGGLVSTRVTYEVPQVCISEASNRTHLQVESPQDFIHPSIVEDTSILGFFLKSNYCDADLDDFTAFINASELLKCTEYLSQRPLFSSYGLESRHLRMLLIRERLRVLYLSYGNHLNALAKLSLSLIEGSSLFQSYSPITGSLSHQRTSDNTDSSWHDDNLNGQSWSNEREADYLESGFNRTKSEPWAQQSSGITENVDPSVIRSKSYTHDCLATKLSTSEPASDSLFEGGQTAGPRSSPTSSLEKESTSPTESLECSENELGSAFLHESGWKAVSTDQVSLCEGAEHIAGLTSPGCFKHTYRHFSAHIARARTHSLQSVGNRRSSTCSLDSSFVENLLRDSSTQSQSSPSSSTASSQKCPSLSPVRGSYASSELSPAEGKGKQTKRNRIALVPQYELFQRTSNPNTRLFSNVELQESMQKKEEIPILTFQDGKIHISCQIGIDKETIDNNFDALSDFNSPNQYNKQNDNNTDSPPPPPPPPVPVGGVEEIVLLQKRNSTTSSVLEVDSASNQDMQIEEVFADASAKKATFQRFLPDKDENESETPITVDSESSARDRGHQTSDASQIKYASSQFSQVPKADDSETGLSKSNATQSKVLSNMFVASSQRSSKSYCEEQSAIHSHVTTSIAAERDQRQLTNQDATLNQIIPSITRLSASFAKSIIECSCGSTESFKSKPDYARSSLIDLNDIWHSPLTSDECSLHAFSPDSNSGVYAPHLSCKARAEVTPVQNRPNCPPPMSLVSCKTPASVAASTDRGDFRISSTTLTSYEHEPKHLGQSDLTPQNSRHKSETMDRSMIDQYPITKSSASSKYIDSPKNRASGNEADTAMMNSQESWTSSSPSRLEVIATVMPADSLYMSNSSSKNFPESTVPVLKEKQDRNTDDSQLSGLCIDDENKKLESSHSLSSDDMVKSLVDIARSIIMSSIPQSVGFRLLDHSLADLRQNLSRKLGSMKMASPNPQDFDVHNLETFCIDNHKMNVTRTSKAKKKRQLKGKSTKRLKDTRGKRVYTDKRKDDPKQFQDTSQHKPLGSLKLPLPHLPECLHKSSKLVAPTLPLPAIPKSGNKPPPNAPLPDPLTIASNRIIEPEFVTSICENVPLASTKSNDEGRFFKKSEPATRHVPSLSLNDDNMQNSDPRLPLIIGSLVTDPSNYTESLYTSAIPFPMNEEMSCLSGTAETVDILATGTAIGHSRSNDFEYALSSGAPQSGYQNALFPIPQEESKPSEENDQFLNRVNEAGHIHTNDAMPSCLSPKYVYRKGSDIMCCQIPPHSSPIVDKALLTSGTFDEVNTVDYTLNIEGIPTRGVIDSSLQNDKEKLQAKQSSIEANQGTFQSTPQKSLEFGKHDSSQITAPSKKIDAESTSVNQNQDETSHKLLAEFVSQQPKCIGEKVDIRPQINAELPHHPFKGFVRGLARLDVNGSTPSPSPVTASDHYDLAFRCPFFDHRLTASVAAAAAAAVAPTPTDATSSPIYFRRLPKKESKMTQWSHEGVSEEESVKFSDIKPVEQIEDVEEGFEVAKQNPRYLVKDQDLSSTLNEDRMSQKAKSKIGPSKYFGSTESSESSTVRSAIEHLIMSSKPKLWQRVSSNDQKKNQTPAPNVLPWLALRPASCTPTPRAANSSPKKFSTHISEAASQLQQLADAIIVTPREGNLPDWIPKIASQGSSLHIDTNINDLSTLPGSTQLKDSPDCDNSQLSSKPDLQRTLSNSLVEIGRRSKEDDPLVQRMQVNEESERTAQSQAGLSDENEKQEDSKLRAITQNAIAVVTNPAMPESLLRNHIRFSNRHARGYTSNISTPQAATLIASEEVLRTAHCTKVQQEAQGFPNRSRVFVSSSLTSSPNLKGLEPPVIDDTPERKTEARLNNTLQHQSDLRQKENGSQSHYQNWSSHSHLSDSFHFDDESVEAKEQNNLAQMVAFDSKKIIPSTGKGTGLSAARHIRIKSDPNLQWESGEVKSEPRQRLNNLYLSFLERDKRAQLRNSEPPLKSYVSSIFADSPSLHDGIIMSKSQGARSGQGSKMKESAKPLKDSLSIKSSPESKNVI